MMGPTHTIVGGSSAFVATSAIGLSWEYVGVATTVAAASSSLPDLDQKWPLKHLVGHREMTHYPVLQLGFFALLVAAAVALAPAYAGAAVVVSAVVTLACVMHSCVDAMTVERHGIKLLWPFSRRGYHLLPRSWRVWVGSKSRSERVFVVIWCAFVLIYAYAHFGHLISA